MRLALGILALALLTGTAKADTVWSYTGNSISYSPGVNPGPIGVNPCGCALDGSVTLDANGAVTGYSFTANGVTLDQTNSTGLLGRTYLFSVSDPADNYFRWAFDLVGQGVEFFSSFDGSYSDSGDYSSNGLDVYADPGSWADPVSSVSEAGTLVLVGFGLAALTLLRRLA